VAVLTWGCLSDNDILTTPGRTEAGVTQVTLPVTPPNLRADVCFCFCIRAGTSRVPKRQKGIYPPVDKAYVLTPVRVTVVPPSTGPIVGFTSNSCGKYRRVIIESEPIYYIG